jgi:cytochrome P450
VFLKSADKDSSQKVAQWIEEVDERHKKGIYSANGGRKTIMDLLMKPEKGYSPLSKESLVDEVNSFCFAGTHTTSFSLTLATFYLLKNPSKLEKMLKELESVPRNANGLLEYRDVCNLPYLVSRIRGGCLL